MRKGYKKSDIGIFPEDWDVKSYGDIFYFLKTATYSRAELTQIDDVKYVHYGDIHTRWNFYLDVSKNDLPGISIEKAKGYSLLQNGDIIMADASEDYSGIGKSVEVQNISDTKAIAGLHTFLFRDINGVFVDGYKAYLHSIACVKKQFDELATGMKVYGVSKTNLKKVILPIPTKAEQTAIATFLSDTDALITSLEKLLEKKRAIKQGVMHELLEPKKGCDIRKVSEIGLVGRGRVISHKEISRSIEGLFPVYSSQTSNNGIMGYLDTYDFDGEYITWTTDGENAGTVFYRNGKFNCTNVCGIIKIKNDNPKYLTYVLNKLTPQHVSKNLANPKLMNEPMKQIEVPLPPIEHQNEISQTLHDIDYEIISLEGNLKKFKMLKQGMMQELLTGKTRLL